MIKDLVIYPDKRISIVSSDVRLFDDELVELLEDMKDTMNANNSDGLSAIQIAVPASVMIIKDNKGDILEFINPRVINHSGEFNSTETTLYLPNITRTFKRYKKFSMVYEDRFGKQHSMNIDGELSAIIQRKIDYIFGSSFVHKFNPAGRKDIENELAGKGSGGSFEDYENISGRDYFKSIASKLLFFQFLTLFSIFFNLSINTLNNLYSYDKIATVLSTILIISYFIYSKYEATKRLSCTGCQVVSFATVTVKFFLIIITLFLLSYYLVNPNI